MSAGKVCAGGIKQKDPEDKDIKNILHKAVICHNASSNDENIVVVKITEASSQVVAGIKYKIGFIGEGEVSKKQYKCTVEVVSQPWITPEPKVLSININQLQ